LLTLLALAAASPCFAQSAQPADVDKQAGIPTIQNYSAREYNSSPQVWTVLQDHRGLMYFGNSGGVVLQFDGVTWRKIFVQSNVVRSLAIDESGKIWVGAGANFGYLEPDATGTLHYVSLLDKVPAGDRGFTDVWQTLATQQGVFFRSYEHLFRWDGHQVKVWSPEGKSRFEALSAVRGHVYTAQAGTGLQEIVGDELRNAPGGEAYKDSIKLFLHPFNGSQILVSARNGLFTLYDGQKVTPFPTQADDYLTKHKLYTSTLLPDGSFCATTITGGLVILEHDGRLRQIIDQGSGLAATGVLSAYPDREGALWLGLEGGIARVEINSPISIFARTGNIDVTRFNGSMYVTETGGNAAVERLVFDRQTGLPSLVPLSGPAQGWILVHFKDPSGKTPDQLLAATSEGVMRVQGDSLVPAMPALHGLPEQTYFIGLSRAGMAMPGSMKADCRTRFTKPGTCRKMPRESYG
jgi:ligand-binding sensor domain-containing protein